jgi:hypothetical protein
MSGDIRVKLSNSAFVGVVGFERCVAALDLDPVNV